MHICEESMFIHIYNYLCFFRVKEHQTANSGNKSDIVKHDVHNDEDSSSVRSSSHHRYVLRVYRERIDYLTFLVFKSD